MATAELCGHRGRWRHPARWGAPAPSVARFLPRAGVVEAVLPSGPPLGLWSRGDDDIATTVFWRGWAGHEPETAEWLLELATSARTTPRHRGPRRVLHRPCCPRQPFGQVYAFEPLARVRERLIRNVALNGLQPPCDWDDPAAREALVDELVHDALAALAVLDGEELSAVARDAADLLALVAGQDVARGHDGVFRIVRGVARDRVISNVDPEASHGHKSHNRRFDGYKAHASVDPTPSSSTRWWSPRPTRPTVRRWRTVLAPHAEAPDKPTVVGDSAYADGATRAGLEDEGYEVVAKTPPPRNSTGLWPKDRFDVNADAATATCPAGHTVAIKLGRDGGGKASLAPHCATCPLRPTAPPRAGAARSPCTPRRHACSGRAPSSERRSGHSATAPTAPLSSASSPVSCGGRGAAARRAHAGGLGWRPTSTPGPVP